MPTTDWDTWNVSEYDNDTVSNTDQHSEPELFTIYIQFAAILSLIVVTVTGNLLLLAIVFRSRQLRSTVSNALIVNLAVADCMVGVFVLPAFAATVLQAAPPALPGLCSVFGVVAVVLSSESLLTLGAIAVDRFLNICHPLVYIRLAEPHKMVIFIGMYHTLRNVIRCGSAVLCELGIVFGVVCVSVCVCPRKRMKKLLIRNSCISV